VNRFRKKITTLLREHGAVLVRQRKHRVYKVAGKTFVESSTPSAKRSDVNHLGDLKRLLEVPRELKPSNGHKRKPGPGRVEPIKYEKIETVSAGFADKLRASGAVEAALRDEIAMNLEHIEVLEAKIAELEGRQCPSRFCRFKRWVSDSIRKRG
jgi:hypothetical protein